MADTDMFVPFSDISGLKESDLFKRNKTLRGFSEQQLKRFLRVFNASFERVIRNGGSEDQAESTAISIALSSAKRASFRQESRPLEASVRFFAPMMKEQLAMDEDGAIEGAEFDFSFVRNNLEVTNAVAVGNEFNDDHDHKKGLGVIAGIILPEQAPDHIRERIDVDTPFLVAASFYQDAPDDAKAQIGISSEWLTFGDGAKKQVIPLTFAITDTPLNGPETGIKRVAGANPYKEQKPESESGQNMADEDIKTLKASLSTKEDELTKVKNEFESFKTGLASLLGKPKEQVTEVAIKEFDGKVASLIQTVEKQTKTITDMQSASLERDAKDWATQEAKSGKFAMDAVPKWASLYVKDSVMAVELVKDLKASLINEAPPQGANASFNAEQTSKLDLALAAAFKGDKK